jgi:glycosyltransferase involved in cell wall biosynthesis
LGTLLASIRGQTRPPDEVIFVDGGSTDRTVELLRAGSGGEERFLVIEAGQATPGRGRNVGAARAAHEWLAFTDAGIRLEPRWLEGLVEAAGGEPAPDVVYGNFEPEADTFFERWAALAYVPPKEPRPGGRMRGPSTASMLMRKSLWQRVGGFPDLRAAEDLIFFEGVRRADAVVAWAPEATAWWRLQPTAGRTFRKFALYSKHNVWAGRQRFWHYGVAKQYALVLPSIPLAAAHSSWWLLAPPAWLLARAAKSVWRRREARPLWWALNPTRLLGVAAVLLTVDAATFAGWAQAALAGGPRKRVKPQPAGRR